MSLYAPNPWTNNVSLNYFIPDEEYKLTSTLTYRFGKGTVTRDVADKSMTLYRELLHWDPYLKSGIQPSSKGNGTTADLMPYNGSIALNNANMVSVETAGDEIEAEMPSLSLPMKDAGEVNLGKIRFIIDYLTPFHVFHNEAYNDIQPGDGWTVSVLKKDWRWDCVYYNSTPYPDLTVYASSMTFHYDNEEIARRMCPDNTGILKHGDNTQKAMASSMTGGHRLFLNFSWGQAPQL